MVNNYDPLDDLEIDQLIELLLEAKRVGFSVSSSPTEVYLDILIDASIRISEAFRIGWEDRYENPSIRFDDRGSQDPLGNSRSIRTFRPGFVHWDLFSSELFRRIANLGARIKNGMSGRAAFAATFPSTTPPAMEADLNAPRPKSPVQQDVNRRYYRRRKNKQRK